MNVKSEKLIVYRLLITLTTIEQKISDCRFNIKYHQCPIPLNVPFCFLSLHENVQNIEFWLSNKVSTMTKDVIMKGGNQFPFIYPKSLGSHYVMCFHMSQGPKPYMFVPSPRIIGFLLVIPSSHCE